ncbi:MAG: AAA-like domain-containing protein [Hormoscilla sp. GUM202]|nr:AAA-like domain-containing protein [Hormoscilla sp. GUM202]
MGAYRQVVTAETPIVLEPQQAFGLICLGLVRKEHNQVTASCQLYRQYFRDRLSDGI